MIEHNMRFVHKINELRYVYVVGDLSPMVSSKDTIKIPTWIGSSCKPTNDNCPNVDLISGLKMQLSESR
jgi:hypothetical protein